MPHELQRVVDSLRDTGDLRHQENQERFRGIEDSISNLNRSFNDHARADREGMDKIAEAIKANTAITTQTHNDTKDIVATWNGLNTTKRVMAWVAVFAGSIATIVAAALYFLGKGPFPGIMS